MEFAWDRAKNEANLRVRRFDFAFATLIFDGVTVEVPDSRKDYGEPRVVAIGLADGVHLTVVYTDRPVPGGRWVRRIFSARRSHRHEREVYQAFVSKDPP